MKIVVKDDYKPIQLALALVEPVIEESDEALSKVRSSGQGVDTVSDTATDVITI